MRSRPWLSSTLMAAFVALTLSACDRPAPDPSVADGTHAHGGSDDGPGPHLAEARVYAAASLTDVIGAIAAQFDPPGGSHVVAAFDASNTLAQQLHAGAPPGVFVSASVEWVDRLEAWGLVEPGTRVDLAGNSLVVIVPKDAKLRPAALSDLADARYLHIALADPVAVPAGRYAKAALERSGTFDALRARIVAALDVRAALAYVERGEAQAGIVYATDAAASARVDVALRVAPDLHARIVYPMVLVKGANRRARELHAYLQTPAAWAVFEKAGFTRP